MNAPLPPIYRDCQRLLLHTEALVLISPRAGVTAANKNRIALAAAAALPLILPSRPNAFRLLIEREMRSIGTSPKIVMEVDGLNAILNLVQEGLGHAVLPAYTLSNFTDIAPFVVRPIHSPQIQSQLALVWSARRPSTQTQKKALEVLQEVIAAQFPKN